MTFGQYIKDARRKLKLSLREFCDINGYDYVIYSKLERDKILPTDNVSYMKDIAKALQLKVGGKEWFDFFKIANTSRDKKDKIDINKMPILKNIKDNQIKELIKLTKE